MQSSASALRREYSSARNSWAACSSTSEGLDHLRRPEAGSQAACRTPARGPWQLPPRSARTPSADQARTRQAAVGWMAPARPWLDCPPQPSGMTGDPRPVAAGLRTPDLPWVIAQKEHAAARSPADGEPLLVAIGEFNCRVRDRRLE